MAYPAQTIYGNQSPSCMNPLACKLKVEGEASIKVQPDTAVVILGVVTENKQLRVAQEENAQKINNIISTLTGMGIPREDIQTQAYTISPQYDYVEGQQIFRGYRVQHSLRITVRNMQRIGEVIDAAVQSGANQVESVTFSLSDPSAVYRRALQLAVDDAQSKAAVLGAKLGVTVSRVPVQIIEQGYQQGVPIVPLAMQAVGTLTPIQSGQIEITARIEAVFAYTRG